MTGWQYLAVAAVFAFVMVSLVLWNRYTSDPTAPDDAEVLLIALVLALVWPILLTVGTLYGSYWLLVRLIGALLRALDHLLGKKP